MTEDEAIRAAQVFAEREGVEIGKLKSIRRIPASELLRTAEQGDVWAVFFDFATPETVVSTPSSILIDVFDKTGEAEFFEGL